MDSRFLLENMILGEDTDWTPCRISLLNNLLLPHHLYHPILELAVGQVACLGSPSNFGWGLDHTRRSGWTCWLWAYTSGYHSTWFLPWEGRRIVDLIYGNFLTTILAHHCLDTWIWKTTSNQLGSSLKY